MTAQDTLLASQVVKFDPHPHKKVTQFEGYQSLADAVEENR